MHTFTIMIQHPEHREEFIKVKTAMPLDMLEPEKLYHVLASKVHLDEKCRVSVVPEGQINEIELDAHKLLVEDHIEMLSGLPGDHFNQPIVSEDMPEYRVELNIDYECVDEETEEENTYFLLFGLFLIDGLIQCELSLNFYVNEAGVEDKHQFDVTNPDEWLSQMETIVDQWDMRKDAYGHAEEFLLKVKSILATLSNEPYMKIQ